ncbi:MAG: hypothetical protein ACPGLV_12310 [Bacteroidia bacterium]
MKIRGTRKQKLVLTLLIALCLVFASFTKFQNNEGYDLKIIQGNRTFQLEPQDEVILEKAPFAFEFTMPKAKMESLQFHIATKNKTYKKYLKGVLLDELEPFDIGKAMSVKVNAYTKLDSSIIINNDDNQPFMYNGKDFTSFHKMDSTQSHYIFTYYINEFYHINGDNRNRYSTDELPFKKLFVITQFDVNSTKWKNFGVLPFIIKWK